MEKQAKSQEKMQYYIIKIVNTDSKFGKTVYKIGMTHTEKRWDDLVRDYNDRRANTAMKIHNDLLPVYNNKYLTDKQIHEDIIKYGAIKVNPCEFQYYIHENGKDEIFEFPGKTQDEVVSLIKDRVAELEKNKNSFKGNLNAKSIKIKYDKDPKKRHEVGTELIEKIENKLGYRITNNIDFIIDIDNRIKVREKNILLIGQFSTEWVPALAVNNNLVIMHDSEYTKYKYDYKGTDDKITYVENIQDIIDMDIKFDIIIANPPYGKIGAKITKAIIDNVEFDNYVNLQPANDYRRYVKGLYHYASDMISVKDGFEDADVTTHIARIHKCAVNNMTDDEFEISTYIDPQLNRYFIENSNRQNVFNNIYLPTEKEVRSVDCSLSCVFTKRDVSHKHLPYSKTLFYKWNYEQSISIDELIEKTNRDFGQTMSMEIVVFEKPIEKTNFTKFIYGEGFRFISKIFTAVNVDSRYDLSKVFPKVDWARPWTVEEILSEYGYSAGEIDEIMEDLDRFKYPKFGFNTLK